MIDQDKCILCGQCVRTCDEVLGIGALGLVNRGFDTMIETIVLGIRAFNTEDELTVKNHWLFDYTKNGGTVVVQYLTNINLKTENIAPFDLKIGKTRVTDEDAVVKFINPNEAVLNKPFKITQENFQNWVQEQGLYYKCP